MAHPTTTDPPAPEVVELPPGPVGAVAPIIPPSEPSSPTPLPTTPPPSPVRALAIWIAPAAWAVLLLLALYFFQPVSTVLMGVLAACIISSTLRPLVARVPGPKGLGLSMAALGLVAIIALIGFLLAWPLHGPISRATANWPQTQQEVDAVLRRWSIKIGLQEAPTAEHPAPPDSLSVAKLLEGVKAYLTGEGGQVLVSKGADVLLGVLLSLAFMLIGSLFLLSEPGDALIEPSLRLVSPRYRSSLGTALRALGPRYRAWVVGTLSGMGIVFVASLLGYSIINLKMALLLALLAGFAEVVPTVGPMVSGVIAILFAAATQSPAHAFGVIIVWGVIQAFEAYVILPIIMRGAVNIHPAVTLFSVVLWGKVFGVAGIIMAIPINLTIWTLLEHLYISPMEGASKMGDET